MDSEEVTKKVEVVCDPAHHQHDHGQERKKPEEMVLQLELDINELDCTNQRLQSLEQVYKLKFLHTLVLRANNVATLEHLAKEECGLSTLRHLELYSNLLTTDEHLQLLPGLTHLDISFNEVRTVEAIGTLEKLQELYLVNNKLTKIQGLERLTDLKLLELGSNRIREIENISQLTNLEELWLGRNKIIKLEGLGTLTKLKKISLQSNRLLTIGPGLANVVNLQELYISHNGLQDMGGLETLTQLTILDLSNNRIKKLEGLENLVLLEELWMNNNFISDWDDLKCVEGATGIQTLYLQQNPLQGSDLAQYRRKCLKYIPSLEQVDADMVEYFIDELRKGEEEVIEEVKGEAKEEVKV